MGDKLVDQDGNVHEQGWDGQYHEKSGVFGPSRETDFLGNPKVDRDIFGNPKEKTDLLGQPVRTSSGRSLFTSGSSSGNDAIGAVIGFLLVIAFVGIFTVSYWIIRALYYLCRNHPKVGYPIVGVLLLGALIASIDFFGRPGAGYGAYPYSSADQSSVASTQTYSVPTATPTPLRPTPTPYPTATRPPTPSVPSRLTVGNADGEGVYIRRTPRMSDRVQAWPDGTTLIPTGRTAYGDGSDWFEVRDPSGFVGWVPAQYVRR